MGRNRFVEPESVRLEISDGDWIEIKKRLAVGEQRQVDGAGMSRVRASSVAEAEPEFSVDWKEFGLARVQAYLLEWSFRDRNDKPVKVTRSALENLDAETFKEIEEVITAHVKSMEPDEDKEGNESPTSPT